MKVVILAGGFGTRLSEETTIKPKPMVEIGGKPILWHIMKIYTSFGFNDFVICLGYKGYCIKEYFENYFLHRSDIQYDFRNGNLRKILANNAEPWKVTLVDTGLETMTGGRIKRVQKYIANKRFMMTYGDGVGNVNIHKLVKRHESEKKIATMTAVQPSGRFGALSFDSDGNVAAFSEKPKGDGSWVNGGFFVLEPEIFDYIEDDATIFEKYSLDSITKKRQLAVYKHSGFWRPMDTLRDKRELNELWESGKAEWRIWED